MESGFWLGILIGFVGWGCLVLQGAVNPEVRSRHDWRVPEGRDRAQGSRGEEQAALNRRGMVRSSPDPRRGYSPRGDFDSRGELTVIRKNGLTAKTPAGAAKAGSVDREVGVVTAPLVAVASEIVCASEPCQSWRSWRLGGSRISLWG